MAIITLDSRTQRAADFITKNLYFGFGRSTEWTNPDLPDIPLNTESEIEELFFIAKVTKASFVISPGVDITFKDTTWREVLEENIYTDNVTNIYLETLLDYDSFEFASFRQVGLLENPLNLLGESCILSQYDDSEISSQGILHYLDNRLVTNRQIDQQELISIILEF